MTKQPLHHWKHLYRISHILVWWYYNDQTIWCENNIAKSKHKPKLCMWVRRYTVVKLQWISVVFEFSRDNSGLSDSIPPLWLIKKYFTFNYIEAVFNTITATIPCDIRKKINKYILQRTRGNEKAYLFYKICKTLNEKFVVRVKRKSIPTDSRVLCDNIQVI